MSEDIKVNERLKPFSHKPGTTLLIPGTTIAATIYPTLVQLYDCDQLIKEIPIHVKGPIKNFTVMQDLEKGVVTVFGEKLFYHILPNLTIKFQKKAPNQHLKSFSRLTLGINKLQNFEKIKERLDFREIFPIWLRLATLLPEVPVEPFSLLDNIALQSREDILDSFKKLFLFAFRGMMVPRNWDEEHQGITKERISGSPFFILKKGGALIHSLFIQEAPDTVFLLPSLPPEFFEGRMVEVTLAFGVISFEWTKKKLRRVVLKSFSNKMVSIHFKTAKRCRINKKENYVSGDLVEIKSGEVYLLDRFEN